MNSNKVSIIVLAHNEEQTLQLAVTKVLTRLDGELDFEIIIVNDNSTDDTPAVAEKLSSRYSRVRVVHRTHGPSFAGALQAGLRAAGGEYLVPFMADLSDDPVDILRLHSKIVDGYDVVVGSRFLPGSSLYGYPLKKFLANRLYNLVVRLLFDLPLRDTTNAFRIYRKSTLERLKFEAKSFDINAEILIKARKLGARITEVPVSWHMRSHGESKMKLARVGIHYGKTLLKLILKI